MRRKHSILGNVWVEQELANGSYLGDIEDEIKKMSPEFARGAREALDSYLSSDSEKEERAKAEALERSVDPSIV